jgi:hypothetical protein
MLQLTGGIGRVRQKMYILGAEPARFTRFYDKVKNNQVHQRGERPRRSLDRRRHRHLHRQHQHF